jgi:hypothetical protein
MDNAGRKEGVITSKPVTWGKGRMKVISYAGKMK